MKLSHIKGERVFDVIADIIDPIANIAEDEGAAALFKREKPPEGVPVKTFLLGRVKSALPALLKGHKGDMIAILAAIEGTSPEEYADGLDLVKLIKDVTDLITDSAFQMLFISAQSVNGSGSARENTGEQEA